MNYWKGDKQTSTEKSDGYESMDATMSFFVSERGPPRKLNMEQELMLVMMRLCLGISVGDLAFRFKISESLVSSIFCTWIKLMSAELSWLMNMELGGDKIHFNYPRADQHIVELEFTSACCCF